MTLMQTVHMGQLERCFCKENLQTKTTFSTGLFPQIFSILVEGTIMINACDFLSLYHLQIKTQAHFLRRVQVFKKPIYWFYMKKYIYYIKNI